MGNLNKILELCKAEGGKLVITDLEGRDAWVILSLEEYTKLRSRESSASLEKLAGKLSALSLQAEELNRQITQAQIEDDDETEEAVEAFDGEAEEKPEAAETLYIEPLEEK